jgi:4-amino-4-deoxy-L-arabinose transferase-like glycosyltransferase
MKNPSTIRYPLSTINFPLSTRAILLITIAFAAILLFPTIYWPFDYDQGTFAYGGAAILRGERPYIDFWDIKPPNVFYTYAVAFKIFGNSVRAIRIFDYLNAIGTIALIFALASRLWKKMQWRNIAAVVASLAFVLQYYIFGHWDTAQAETHSLPFLIAAMLLVIPTGDRLTTRSTWLRPLLAGILIGISFYFKFPNGLFLVLAAVAFWQYSGRERRGKIAGIAWLCVGCFAAIGIESFYLAINGELLPLWQITTSSTASYVAANYSGSFTLFQNLRTALQAVDPLWFFVGIGGWCCWFVGRTKRTVRDEITAQIIFLIIGCAIAMIIVQMQNKGYKYHYAVLLPWVDILIGGGIAILASAFSRIDRLSQAWNAVILSILLISVSFAWSSWNPLHDRFAEMVKISNGSQPANGYIESDTLSNYISIHSQPNDRIFIFGFAPYVYWKSGRKPATKFLNTIHFKPNYVPKLERYELIYGLTGNPPELLLVQMGDRYSSQGNTNDDSRTTIRLRYPEIEEMLKSRYRIEDTVQHTIIYRLCP